MLMLNWKQTWKSHYISWFFNLNFKSTVRIQTKLLKLRAYKPTVVHSLVLPDYEMWESNVTDNFRNLLYKSLIDTTYILYID
jgi:hypothetical protein